MKKPQLCAPLLAAALMFSPNLIVAQTSAAQTAAAATTAKLSSHVKKDIERHRAIALAHEGAARCLESGKTEDDCLKELQAACKGLAIGKYCGMRHAH
jgi:hypothetical protein